MYNNILIISDNLYLCKEFETIIDEQKIDNVEWNFAISPLSNLDIFSEVLNNKVQVVNLRNKNFVNLIISNYDLIFSIHCKQIFPSKLVDNIKCINIHPGYNPINRGWFPQVFAILNNFKIGATIHEIDNKLDHGPIIARQNVVQHKYDTSETLYNRILSKEIELLRTYLKDILNNTYKTIIPENEGTLFLKKDFEALRELDLNKEQTVGETIDLLRAMTHGNYKNAYFIDSETKEKIYVSINLTKEN